MSGFDLTLEGVVMQISVRKLLPADLSAVMQINREPWSGSDFLRYAHRGNTNVKVAVHTDRVVGFIVYETHKTKFNVLNLGVHPDFRRRGVGRQLLQGLKSRLTAERRTEVTVTIRETALDAAKFFSAEKFQAKLSRNFYGYGTDGYEFRYRPPVSSGDLVLAELDELPPAASSASLDDFQAES
jgi:ribosomal-protein-alanine N-acetyltransferase